MAVMTALAVGSIALSAYGQWRAGKAEKAAGKLQREAAESQAELAEYNANVAALQAEDAEDRGHEEEQRFRRGVDGLVGGQRVGFAGGNVLVNEGSARDVQLDAATLGELDALTIRTNAAREAWGYRVEQEDLTRRAEIARKEGYYLEQAGNARGNAQYINAANSVVGGSASLLMARYGMGRAPAKAGA